MEDLIKRSDAKRFFTEFLSLNRFADFKNANIERLVSILCERIPSAEKQGKWIDHDSKVAILGLRWKCSCCGIVASDRTRFCPTCGARMKGADDEQE